MDNEKIQRLLRNFDLSLAELYRINRELKQCVKDNKQKIKQKQKLNLEDVGK